MNVDAGKKIGRKGPMLKIFEIGLEAGMAGAGQPRRLRSGEFGDVRDTRHKSA